MNKTTAAVIIVAVLHAGAVWAHSGTHTKQATAAPASVEQMEFGIAGDSAKVTRTIQVSMGDDMRFNPSHIEIKMGETVRFVVQNRGKLMHEMVIGTMQALAQHAESMKKHPGMEHDEPYMAHVQPGKTETIVWHFNRAGEFHIACLVAGHFEAGMVGKLIVR